MRVFVFSILVFLSGISSLSGQCPDRDFLWKKMTAYQNNPSLPAKEQLSNLLQHESAFKDCKHANDSVHAWLLMRIGIMYYKLEEYGLAIQYTRRAVDMVYSNSENDRIKDKYLAKFFYNLSICYDSLRMIPQRNEAIDSCVSYEMRSTSSYQYSFFLLLKSTKALYYKGDYNICADHASLGESIIHKYYRYSDSMDYIIFFISYRALSLFALEKYDEAGRFLQSREREFKKISNQYYTGVVYNLFGQLNETKGNYPAAINWFKKAFEMDKRTVQQSTCPDVLNGIGKIYRDKYHHPDAALRYFNLAARYAKDKGLSDIYADIGRTFKEQKNYDSALLFFQKSFDVIKPGSNEQDVLAHTDEYIFVKHFTTRHLLNLVLDKADTYLAQFYAVRQIQFLQQAELIYKSADRLLDKIKTLQTEQESKLFWRGYTRRLYEHAIDACFQAGNANDALYFFEKSRAVLLNDQLNEGRYLNAPDILKLAQVKKKIRSAEKTYQQNSLLTKSDNDAVRELFLNRQQLNKLEQSVKNNNPVYYQVFFDTGFVSVADIREELLKEHQCLLELFNGDSAVFSLLITQTQSFLTKISKPRFDSLANLYKHYLTGPSAINTAYYEYLAAASGLYKLICENHVLPPGRIIVSPDGQYFPFEALVTSETGKPAIYFLNEHVVSYTYSARFLMNRFNAGAAEAFGDFMGLAPVSFPAALSLAPLAGSDVSLNNISSHFKSYINLTASRATRNNFLQQFYQYKIIQLYTHATDSSKNKEPAIYFADSVLFLSELINEKKTLTKLIVLSACETGSGTLYKGEGVFSFNRAFAALGVPSSVTNLWSVDNRSTYKLTELFYKYLSQGLPLDIALQKAKLEYISSADGENRLPYYWAAPVLVGKTDAIEIKNPNTWKYIFAGVGLAGLIFFIWKKISKRKRATQVQDIAQTAA